jgi:hypothetical protein
MADNSTSNSTKSLTIAMISQLPSAHGKDSKRGFLSKLLNAPPTTPHKLICGFNVASSQYDHLTLTPEWTTKFPTLKNLLNRFNSDAKKIPNLSPFSINYHAADIDKFFRVFGGAIIIACLFMTTAAFLDNSPEFNNLFWLLFMPFFIAGTVGSRMYVFCG